METPIKTHPMILVAAASVTALSLTGVAALAGFMPGKADTAPSPIAPVAAIQPAETAKDVVRAPVAQKSESPTTLTIPSGSRITVEPKTQSARTPRSETRQVAAPAAQGPYARVSTQPVSDNGIYVENGRPAPIQTQQAAQPQTQPVQPYAPAPATCYDCGTVESIREISNKGEGTGLGAVAGGVLGGLLGSQIGGGNGKKAMAVVGAAGGAFAGHEVEKRMRGETQYEITVRFDDGRTRTFTETQAPQLRSGDRVRTTNGQLSMI